MRGRKFTKIIEIWQTIRNPDGYSGNDTSPILLTKTWCSIRTANASSRFRTTDNGITTATNQIIITTRKRRDITFNNVNQFIRYRDEDYVISNQPYETDFDNSFIEIVATKVESKNIPTIDPI